VLITHDVPARRVGRLAAHTSQLQCQRVGDEHVSGAVHEDERVRRAGAIEIPAGRVAVLGQLVVVVTAPADPTAGRRSFGTLGEAGNDLLDRTDRRIAAVDLPQHETEIEHMVVGFVEAG
jgi:hypothetical protein